MPRISVVRHAPVTLSGICYGQSEVPTTISAEEAARVITAQLEKPARIRTVWSSPFIRCREPAQLLAAQFSAGLRVDPRLSELSFGEWELRSYDELARDDGPRFHAWANHWETATPPGGESIADLIARVRSVLGDVRAASEDALVVTHAGVVRALSTLLDGRDQLSFKDPVPYLVVRNREV